MGDLSDSFRHPPDHRKDQLSESCSGIQGASSDLPRGRFLALRWLPLAKTNLIRSVRHETCQAVAVFDSKGHHKVLTSSLHNELKSGKEWTGKKDNFLKSPEIKVNLLNIDLAHKGIWTVKAAARRGRERKFSGCQWNGNGIYFLEDNSSFWKPESQNERFIWTQSDTLPSNTYQLLRLSVHRSLISFEMTSWISNYEHSTTGIPRKIR